MAFRETVDSARSVRGVLALLETPRIFSLFPILFFKDINYCLLLPFSLQRKKRKGKEGEKL